ncbi:MAG: outer membrane beta-barrel protein [Verrucomicrobia bacterium]|nr:outer membrane beta-barrel protein [Verrucomicrobiota bacterium]
MKTLITCASLAAVGMTGVQAQSEKDAAPAKPFQVYASVRGFYDDNYTTGPDKVPASYPAGYMEKRDSWGFSVAPGVSLDVLRDQTSIRLGYDFDYRYYEDRPDNNADMAHNFKLNLNHRFNEQFKLEVFDSFVIGQEPELLNPADGQATQVLRVSGDNIRNYGGVGLLANFSEHWGSRVNYANTFYDYDLEGDGSYSALMDRMEHLATVDLRYQYNPTVLTLIGYQYGLIEQTSDDKLALGSSLSADVRDRNSHYGFLGVDYDLSSQFSTQLRGGVQYTEYPNAPAGNDDDFVSPYFDALLMFRYSKDSRAQLGVKYGLSQTDVAVTSASDSAITQDAESLTVYAAVVHRLTSRLYATARAQWMMANFHGGVMDDEQDNYYGADVSLTYEINRYLAVEAGYLWDKLDSDIEVRRYSRNRVFAGIKATF